MNPEQINNLYKNSNYTKKEIKEISIVCEIMISEAIANIRKEMYNEINMMKYKILTLMRHQSILELKCQMTENCLNGILRLFSPRINNIFLDA